ncbi:MAG TPA: hypothetical protein V6D17_19080 [Candidatus Obscuribacterales bacterium]
MRRIGIAALSVFSLMAALAVAPANAQQCGVGPGFGNGFGNSFGTGLGTSVGASFGTNIGPLYGSGFGYGYVPAYNQGFGFNVHPNPDTFIDNMQAQMQLRINRGLAQGRLSPSEASRLQSRMNQIANLEARMRLSGNQLTFSERQSLINRITALNHQITHELNDSERVQIGAWGHRFWR